MSSIELSWFAPCTMMIRSSSISVRNTDILLRRAVTSICEELNLIAEFYWCCWNHVSINPSNCWVLSHLPSLGKCDCSSNYMIMGVSSTKSYWVTDSIVKGSSNNLKRRTFCTLCTWLILSWLVTALKNSNSELRMVELSAIGWSYLFIFKFSLISGCTN